MVELTSVLTNLKNRVLNQNKIYENKVEKEQYLKRLMDDKLDLSQKVNDTAEIIQLLATASDNTTMQVLKHIQMIINQALKRIYTNAHYEIDFQKTMYGNKTPTIQVKLTEYRQGKDPMELDFKLQAGDSVAQIIAFLFSLSLIEIRGIRPILMLDETLKGFHQSVIPIIESIIQVFAENGFQFVLIEYDIFMGKGYEVIRDKENSVSNFVEMKQDWMHYFKQLHEKKLVLREVEQEQTPLHIPTI